MATASLEFSQHTLNQALLANSAIRGENAALRQALQVNLTAVNSLFRRLLESESEQPWLADALRRSEQRCAELEAKLVAQDSELEALRGEERVQLEAQLAHLNDELARVYATKTFRILRPARRVWALARRAAGSGGAIR